MNEEQKKYIKAYEENADALFRFCLLSIRDREVAKDLVQEAFVKTWNYMVNKGPIENLKAFLYKTLRNLIIDYYRLKKSESLDVLLEEEGFDPRLETPVSEEEKVDSVIAFKMLRYIPKEYQEVITMRLVEEMSFKEIGSITGEPENTVAVRFHRGIKKVRAIFFKQNDEQQI